MPASNLVPLIAFPHYFFIINFTSITKFVPTTPSLLTTSHMVTPIRFLNTMPTFGTLLCVFPKPCPARAQTPFKYLFPLILFTCQPFVPGHPMVKTILLSTVVTSDSRVLLPCWVYLAIDALCSWTLSIVRKVSKALEG